MFNSAAKRVSESPATQAAVRGTVEKLLVQMRISVTKIWIWGFVFESQKLITEYMATMHK